MANHILADIEVKNRLQCTTDLMEIEVTKMSRFLECKKKVIILLHKNATGI